MKGTVKFFKTESNFGFITAEDGTDYFVHGSALEEGMRLNKEDSVTFDVDESGEKGPKAVNVKKA